ncbi:hypothetical protein EZ313_21325 [Ramlibacter henchirensis]|uniref:Uncharacterized protein n=1 Tax=Ramlibacter henchirensis TaxID=204072 RepID=A0A4Z0BQ51_9BURK|nr:hypothetical protein [Ramlibacter henchirensis]TFZ00971.1 hypothetical protein EZ313_21325 [Ramlibacter henchirensis]
MFADRAAEAADGALHLLQQPMALGVLTSVALVIRDVRRERVVPAAALFVSAATVTLALQSAGWHATFVAGCLVVFGAVCAAAIQPSLLVMLALCATAGFALGFGAGVPFATAAEAFGALSTAGLILLALHASWQVASGRWPESPLRRLAPRVIAAWLTALGLLMLALALLRR